MSKIEITAPFTKVFETFAHNIDTELDCLGEEVINKVISKDLSEKINRVYLPENDPFGIRKPYLKFASLMFNTLYKYWNRVEVFGIDNVPDKGAGIIIANHGGIIPLDAAYIASAMIIEREPPRLVRTLVERFLPRIPYFYTFISRSGQTVGTYENAEIILDQGELLQIFPEGAKGATKPYYKYYNLEEFNVGFMELAIRKKVPIIPVGVTGSHEQAPVLFNSKIMAKLLNMPAFPITPFWPLFGPIGGFPLPSKYRIVFGRPMSFSEYDEETINDPEKIQELVNKVRSEVKHLVDIGLDMRKVPFF